MTRRSTTPPTDGLVTPSLAVDFANTVACPGCRGGDALASTAEARRWLRSKLPRSDAPIAASDLAVLRRFRTQLRDLLGAATDRARPPRGALDEVNRAAGGSMPRLVLRWNRNHWVAEERTDPGPASQRLTALVASSAIDLLGKARSPPLRRCQGPGCIHFLVARRIEQRWCSPSGCGNRARVQRHYRKVRSLSSPKRIRRARGRGKA